MLFDGDERQHREIELNATRTLSNAFICFAAFEKLETHRQQMRCLCALHRHEKPLRESNYAIRINDANDVDDANDIGERDERKNYVIIE